MWPARRPRSRASAASAGPRRRRGTSPAPAAGARPRRPRRRLEGGRVPAHCGASRRSPRLHAALRGGAGWGHEPRAVDVGVKAHAECGDVAPGGGECREPRHHDLALGGCTCARTGIGDAGRALRRRFAYGVPPGAAAAPAPATAWRERCPLATLPPGPMPGANEEDVAAHRALPAERAQGPTPTRMAQRATRPARAAAPVRVPLPAAGAGGAGAVGSAAAVARRARGAPSPRRWQGSGRSAHRQGRGEAAVRRWAS
ncbi:unnamed protein product [Prorocentrum cordatum]|uniref:Uncharacterized protein n=1 Tax=Prorocentrum cordatum TaxID=2364126 RepID=A0ABN9RSA9_9DINO|nr:unnamed protein product [Polarella glacialis]